MVMEEMIKNQFMKIMEEKKIASVYQPIVSLVDGSIYGYEALSRIQMECDINTEKLFHIAEKMNKLWELEELCRMSSLKNAKLKPRDTKLFLNVDANIIHDKKFQNGITRKKLQEYGLNPKDIIFEITERTAVEDEKTFKQSVRHYQEQKYQIAIDDVGSAYSGLNRICAVDPNYLKIDMNLIRDIHKDPIKKALVESMVNFCQVQNIDLIAEGIESEEELETLISMGVTYGQGYYLSHPTPLLEEIPELIKGKVEEIHKKYWEKENQISLQECVETICNANCTTSLTTRAVELYEKIKNNSTISEICVLGEEGQVLGVLTRSNLIESFGGRFGYNLNYNRKAEQLMKKDFLIVDCTTPIVKVSQLAMERAAHQVYDAVVVTRNNRYIGVVTVKELLTAVISIQVKRAEESNPLTGLPGNHQIEACMKAYLAKKAPFFVLYFDLDNFKAYNDVYGFTNGDLMIKLVADCIQECCNHTSFIGHIGGDDFVVITQKNEIEEMCEDIFDSFNERIRYLYTSKDWDKKNIISKNRNGKEENYPLASISVAALNIRNRYDCSIEELSKKMANIKKTCKEKPGNTLVIKEN